MLSLQCILRLAGSPGLLRRSRSPAFEPLESQLCLSPVTVVHSSWWQRACLRMRILFCEELEEKWSRWRVEPRREMWELPLGAEKRRSSRRRKRRLYREQLRSWLYHPYLQRSHFANTRCCKSLTRWRWPRTRAQQNAVWLFGGAAESLLWTLH
jgi:hypothetical protein